MRYLDIVLAQSGIVGDDSRRDAAFTAAAEKQLEYGRRQSYDILYPQLKWASFIPVDTSVPAGAETIAYEQWDETGEAVVIANGADDLPLADTAKEKFTNRTATIGASYRITMEDIERAAMSGSSIQSRRQRAALNSVARKLDTIAALGETLSGLKGFCNHDQVPVIAATGTWTGLTATQLVAELHRMEDKVWSDTKEIHEPDTLVLPTAQFQLINRTYMSTDNDMTVAKRFLANASHIKNIQSWSKLATAGVSNVARAVCYKKDPECVQIALPVPVRELPPQAKNLAMLVPMFAKIGGVEWYYPKSACYMDGL